MKPTAQLQAVFLKNLANFSKIRNSACFACYLIYITYIMNESPLPQKAPPSQLIIQAKNGNISPRQAGEILIQTALATGKPIKMSTLIARLGELASIPDPKKNRPSNVWFGALRLVEPGHPIHNALFERYLSAFDNEHAADLAALANS